MGKGALRQKRGPAGETRALIAQAYAGFNAASDGDLVEAYIYEIQSLQARYSYLLRCRKALDGEEAPREKKGSAPLGERTAIPLERKPLDLVDAPGAVSSGVLPVA